MKVIIFCPEWEVLYEKCLNIFENLRMFLNDVELRHELYLDDIKLVEVRDSMIKLPQIVLLEGSRAVKRLSRDLISSLDVEKIIKMLIG